MSTISKLITIIMFAILWVCSAETKLKFAYSDVEAFPNQMGNGEKVSDPPGIAVEIISQAAKKCDISIELVRLPNKRVLIELEKGNVDGAFSYSLKEDRLIQGQYPMKDGKTDNSSRIMTVSYYLYVKKGSPITWDGKKFTNLTGLVGGNAGNSIVDDLKKMGVEVEEAKTIFQNLKKLNLSRIVAYAGQDITTEAQDMSGEFKDIVRLPIPLSKKDYFLMFSHQFMKKNSDVAEKLWKMIGQLRDSITKESISKYKNAKD